MSEWASICPTCDTPDDELGPYCACGEQDGDAHAVNRASDDYPDDEKPGTSLRQWEMWGT